jgi:hypothetical protein
MAPRQFCPLDVLAALLFWNIAMNGWISKRWLWCWVLLGVATTVVAYVRYSAPPYKIEVVDSNAYDAGKIVQGDIVEHVFQIRNRGRNPVSITQTVASCSCTAIVEGAEKTIRPGQSINIPVQFNSRGKYGLSRERIAIQFDTPALKPVLLGIQAMVAGPVQWSPWQVKFGLIDTKEPQPPRMIFVRANEDDLKGTWVAESSNKYVTATVIPIDKEKYPELGGETGKMIKVSLSMDVPVGQIAGDVILKVSETGRQLCVVPIHGRMQGDLYPSPRRVFLGEIAPNQSQTATVEIRRAAGCSGQVKSIESSSLSVKVRVLETLENGPIAARIEVSGGSAVRNSGVFSGKINVKTTDPSQEMFSIDTVGICLPNL